MDAHAPEVCGGGEWELDEDGAGEAVVTLRADYETGPDCYGYGGGGGVCCGEGFSQPATLHVTVLKNGELYAEYEVTPCGNFTGDAFDYAFDCEAADPDDRKPLVQCSSFQTAFFAIPPDPDVPLQVLSCSPLHLTGTSNTGGNLWEVEVTE